MSPLVEFVVSGSFGVASGILSGFLGIGGGAILPPLLVFALGIEQHKAQGISLAALLPPVGLPAVLAYRRKGIHVNVRLVLSLIGGFVVGGLLGAWLAHRVPARELRWAFALFLAISAYKALRSKPDDAPAPIAGQTPVRTLSVGVPIGFLAGIMSGLLGVGGGLVALPLLRKFGGMGRLQAQATTLAMMLPPIGLPAALVYAQQEGGLPWTLLGAVALGFAGGAAVGAQLAGRVPAKAASRVYGAFLAVMALILVLYRK